MLLLAAKLLIVGSIRSQAPLAPLDINLWNSIKPSICYLQSGKLNVGAGAFVTVDGYFVTHQISASQSSTSVVTSTGQTLNCEFVVRDAASQLTLYKTEKPPVGVKIVQIADANDGGSGAVIAVLANGPVRAEITKSQLVGVDKRTRRTVPMNEVRIEEGMVPVGGALIFSGKGRLVGAIAATLLKDSAERQPVAQDQAQDQARSKEFLNSARLVQRGGTGTPLGPQDLAIAYTPTWEVTTKAINGFVLNKKQAEYGFLGIRIVGEKDGRGVRVVEVDKASGADLTGIQVDDVIESIHGLPTRNPVEFCRVTYRLIPNSNVEIKFRRGSIIFSQKVFVGTQPEQLAESQQFAIASSFDLEIR
jgi:S1-C subfamily serine protease